MEIYFKCSHDKLTRVHVQVRANLLYRINKIKDIFSLAVEIQVTGDI